MASEMADVTLFYNEKDEELATGIKDALQGINLRVKTSYDDILAGQFQIGRCADLVEQSRSVVLIVTSAFVKNEMNELQTQMSLWHSIMKCPRQKVIPVKYDNDCPLNLDVFNGIDGQKQPDEIAAKISATVEYIKKSEPSSANPVEVEIKEYQLKALKIIDDATTALVQCYKMDATMKELHQSMQYEVGEKGGNVQDPESDAGCSCRQGELWKKEISDGKYWAISSPQPFKNIDKFKGPNSADKHTADIHKLYQPGGYLKLAAVFLFKRPLPTKPKSQCQNLVEYLDQDGILQLLDRCKAFNATDEERNSIGKVREARHRVAHNPHSLPTEDEQQQFVEGVAEGVEEALYRLLSRQDFKKLTNQIGEVKSGKVNMTIVPGSNLEREADQLRQNQERQDIQGVLQSLGGLEVGGSSAEGGDGGASN